MTYLVLARKWRPRSFDTLIGQDHVVRALTHALSTQRLHHAWLFTGTRGVGKTTLSRILAKSLNCENGITPTPCGKCRACTEIDEGRFVDYLELDAASNRGVDEMTQLLEQAVYSPSVGRYKVYMIDEVHMLTGHAFNAMLKTLEEPPPHVKFILATTDPQKIPVTVLSRCLQFNLKQMAASSIVDHLQFVLGQEDIAYEVPALRLIAQAASGSMRDALSLADQAIAYSAENISTDAVRGMLGTIDQRYLARLLHALAGANSSNVLAVADELATRGLSYSGALADLAILLSRIAIEQRLPGTAPADDPMADEIAQLAQQLHPDLVQLFYSVAVHSRSELSLAPDEYAGFVMACLRMLSLAPTPEPASTPEPEPEAKAKVDPEPVPELGQQESNGSSNPPVQQANQSAPNTAAAAQAHADQAVTNSNGTLRPTPQKLTAPTPDSVATPIAAPHAPSLPDDTPAWEDDSRPGVAPDTGMPNGSSAQDESAIEPAGTGLVVEESTDSDIVINADSREADFDPDDSELNAAPDDDSFETVAHNLQKIAPATAPTTAATAPTSASSSAPSTLAKAKTPRLKRMTAAGWPELAAALPLTGLAAELARQSEWLGVQDNHIKLRVAVRSLDNTQGRARLRTVLSEHFAQAVLLDIQCGSTGDGTAHAVKQARQQALQEKAEHDVQTDPVVQALVDQFDGHVIPGSVHPLPEGKAA